jgi:hypothetical protein
MSLPLLTPTRVASGHQARRPQRTGQATLRDSRHQPTSLREDRRTSEPRHPSGHGMLGHYLDREGRPRDVVALPGPAGSLLVVDRDARTLEDRRLVAHLSPEEPSANAGLVCRHYLQDEAGRWCRRVVLEDLERPPAHGGEPSTSCTTEKVTFQARDGQECSYRLERISMRRSISQLRWCGPARSQSATCLRPVSVREVIAAGESYEPVRHLTVAALARHQGNPEISVTTLRAELERMDASRIVLNRGLRLAVLAAVRREGLSMSQIAIRCGRIKYDANGNASGETSWLARRVGMLPEGGGSRPTPWIHSEVLGLIARRGLGISPREVELG